MAIFDVEVPPNCPRRIEEASIAVTAIRQICGSGFQLTSETCSLPRVFGVLT
jgi:hypothetical protein